MSPINEAISSPILFHQWKNGDINVARFILESICKKGFLLTTNMQTLDTFFIDRGPGSVPMEVMQHPRICFTDIPFDRLSVHGKKYGKYGLGFRRETIIDWGGLPVWYLPNHWGNGTLKCVGPVLVNAVHAVMDAANQFIALVNIASISVNYEHGGTVDGAQLRQQLQQTTNAIFAVLSFVKEMSPQAVEDFRYLYEREWRIIPAFGLSGHDFPCRVLSEDEKTDLCARKPEWLLQCQSQDINITSRYLNEPLINSFRIFNGLPGQKKVAELARFTYGLLARIIL